jgi:hypothetical protein
MSKNVNITATGQAFTGNGVISGVIVCSNSSGTLKLNDQPGAGNLGRTVLDTYTFAAGSSSVIFPSPLQFTDGLFATVGGTGVFELVINENTAQIN